MDIRLIEKELKRTFLAKNKWMLFVSVFCLTILSGLNVMDIRLIEKELKRTFLAKNKWMLFVSVFCLTILSGLNVYISVLMQQIIDTIAERDMERLIQVSLYSLATFVLLILVYLIQRQACPAFIRRAATQYKTYAFERLLQKSLRSVSAENTSKYISMLTNDVNSIESNYLSPLFTFFMDIVGLVIAVIVMFAYSPFLAVLAILFALLPVCLSLFCSNKLARAEKAVSEQNEGFVNSIKEIFSGFFVIKTFQVEREMLGIFQQENTKTESAKFERRKTSELVNLLSMGAGVFAQLGIFIVAAIYSIVGNKITPGTVIIFLNLMNFIVSPITSIPAILANRKAVFELINKMANILFEKSVFKAEIIHNKLEREIVVQDLSFAYNSSACVLKNISVRFEKGKSYAIVGPSGSGKSTLLSILLGTYDSKAEIIHNKLEREIVVQDLSFAYNSSACVLKNISVRFEKGKSYAIVGPSGSGKSTLLSILLGTYDSYQGHIFIDGIERKEIKQTSVYELFSIIHQNVFIFSGSLKDNITLFKEYSDNQINRVVKIAGLSELVSSKGLNYICSENGANLSGGERQRIAIARCLLHAAPVLLVDEATASLDRIISTDLLNSILDLQGITKMVVTHYLEESTLKRFDTIITVSGGQISEMGSFDELMEQRGLFYSMMMSGKEELL